MEGKQYLLALNYFERFGPRRLKRLFDYFLSWENVWQAQYIDLKNCGLSDNTINLFFDFRKKHCPETLFEQTLKNKIKLLFIDEENYPNLLKEIYDPPFVLFYRGEINEKTFASPLAIVGTRKMSSYGQEVTKELVKQLVDYNMTIVSGLAFGIDIAAHEAALDNNGLTVAFLGSGVDQIYPRNNTRTAQKILDKGGAIISEFIPGALAFKTNFPRRNRLIAGSCLGTLVIEAGEKSGTLITARYALEEGREVFAVPGSIFSQGSATPHSLIKAGARLVVNASDISEALGLEKIKVMNANQKFLPATKEESMILELLGGEVLHINELARLAKLDITVINSRLTIMEMKGLVKHLGNMNYVRMRQPTQSNI